MPLSTTTTTTPLTTTAATYADGKTWTDTWNNVSSSATDIYQYAWKKLSGQPETPQQPPTKTQQVLQFFNNHPTLTKAIAYPLILYGIKKTANVFSKLYRSRTVLELDLSLLALTEKPVTPLDKLMNPNKVWYRDIIEALQYAKRDPKIIGLIAKFGGEFGSGLGLIGFGHVNELRSAIRSFSESKLSIGYGDMFGGAASAAKATREYWFATAFKELYMVPTGMVIVPGMILEGVFIKKTLEKLEVEFQGVSREEYKTAINMFTEEKFTKHHKEQYEMLLNGLCDGMVADIAQSRGVSEQIVRGWFDKALFTAQEAKDANLIDGTLFRDEIYEQLPKKLNLEDREKPNFLFLSVYLNKRGRMYENGNKQVALIFAEGAIVQGEESPNPFKNSEAGIHADTVATHIRNARKNKDISAIIIRVDSPGGDAIASDIINREIELAKKDGKKVIISMASIAASGGYWISASADHIVCNPFTITGSIGVIFGKVVTRDLMSNKLGVTFDDVQSNKNSTLFSLLHRFDDEQIQITNKVVDWYYDSFKQHVSRGRKLELDNVAQIAKGQIYLGKQAKQMGLVDTVGGLTEAIQVAKDLIQFDREKDRLKIVIYPKHKPIVQALLNSQQSNNSEQREKKMASASMFPFLGLLTQPFAMLSSYFNVMKSFGGLWSILGFQGGVQSVVPNMNGLSSTMMATDSNNVTSRVSMYDPMLAVFNKI